VGPPGFCPTAEEREGNHPWGRKGLTYHEVQGGQGFITKELFWESAENYKKGAQIMECCVNIIMTTGGQKGMKAGI